MTGFFVCLFQLFLYFFQANTETQNWLTCSRKVGSSRMGLKGQCRKFEVGVWWVPVLQFYHYLHVYCLRQDLILLSWSSPNRPNLLATKPQQPACVGLPSSRTTSMYHHAQCSMQMMSIELGSPCFWTSTALAVTSPQPPSMIEMMSREEKQTGVQSNNFF